MDNKTNHSPEVFAPDEEQQAFILDDGEMYLSIQFEGDYYDYTIYYRDYSEYDGGQLDEPDLSMTEAVHTILSSFDLDALPRKRCDYDDLEAATTAVALAQLSRVRSQKQLSLDDQLKSVSQHDTNNGLFKPPLAYSDLER